MFNDFFKTPGDYALDVAAALKDLRKSRKLSQRELSSKSGVSYASLRRFEETGNISFLSLLKIAYVLDCIDDFDRLFRNKEILSIQELIDG